MNLKASSIIILLISIVFLSSGCGTVPLRTPLPERFAETAQVPDLPRARFWGDETPWFFESIMELPREKVMREFPGIYGKEHHYLALSGGGAQGAFGAGLLAGWSAAGTRPQFTMVTGISTGALISTFAFLGEKYDDQLKEMYTNYSTKDLVRKRTILATLTGASAADTAPLRKMLAKYIDKKVMEKVAKEHKRGRRLFVGTTNLDAKRPVIWNIGLIASSGKPDALELIHDVIVASASIPAAFPPVLVKVEADGKIYDELHVDGGAASQVFLYPAELDWGRVMERLEVKGTPSAYVVRNSFLKPDWETVQPKIISIAGISISSLIRTQGIGDMYRIYLDCRRDGIDYHLAYIPDNFDMKPDEEFDPVYMGALFDLGYRMAENGFPWDKAPPGFQ